MSRESILDAEVTLGDTHRLEHLSGGRRCWQVGGCKGPLISQVLTYAGSGLTEQECQHICRVTKVVGEVALRAM